MYLFSYPAIFTVGSDGRVLVEFVDLPRVATDGKDEREAMEEAMDALGSDLSIRLSRREEIPAPSRAKRGQRLVPFRSGWRRNSRFIWPCATRASATLNWRAALASMSGWSAACSIRNTPPRLRRSKPLWPSLASS